jgi:hypothetical protein
MELSARMELIKLANVAFGHKLGLLTHQLIDVLNGSSITG